MAQTEYIYADIDEILFEYREHTYGAYELRKQYHKRLFRALALVFLIFFVGVIGPHISRLIVGIEPKIDESRIICYFPVDTLVYQQKKKDPKILSKLKKTQSKVKPIIFTIPKPTPEDELEPEEFGDPVSQQDLLFQIPRLIVSDLGDEDFDDYWEWDDADKILESIQAESEPSPQDFIFVDQEPIPVNINDIKLKIDFPQIARNTGLEGNVIIRVLVDEYGKYQKHIVIHKVHPILSNEVEKHISGLRFTPALQSNKPIKFWVNIPFNFKLLE